MALYVSIFFVSANGILVIVLVAPGNKLCCHKDNGTLLFPWIPWLGKVNLNDCCYWQWEPMLSG